MGAIDTYPPQNISAQTPLLAYAEVTANQGSITTEVDLTGLTVTVTVPVGGRRIRLMTKANFQSTIADDRVGLRIYEGATLLNEATQTVRTATSDESIIAEAIITPTAGIHTYKIRGLRVSGTGTVTMVCGATFPAFISVEDITGSQLPVLPQSVPVGQLGYAERTSDQTSVTSRVQISPLSVNVSVPAGRTLRIKLHAGLSRTVADGVTRFFLVQDGATIQFKDMFVRGALEGHINVDFEVIVSPTAGSHTYTADIQQVTGTGTSTAAAGVGEPAFLLVEDISPTPAPGQGAPGSTLGYAEVTASQAGITTITDLTNLTTTVTVPSGRRIRITGEVIQFSRTAGTVTFAELSIWEGATQLTAKTVAIPNTYGGATVSVVVTPSSGTHTYKLRARTDGTVQMDATSTAKNFILVEDITGAIWPVGSAVTAGMVASEAWTSYTPTLTNMTLGNGTVSAAYYKVGRKVTVRFKFKLGSTSAMGTNPCFSLPVTAHAIYVSGEDTLGDVNILDSGTTNFRGQLWTLDANTARCIGYNSTGSTVNITSTVPMTWTTNDVLSSTFVYEAVS